MKYTHRLRKILRRTVWYLCDKVFTLSGLFCVEVATPSLGFFAFIGGMIPMLHLWQRKGLKPRLLFSSKSYTSLPHGPSFFDYFFDGPRYSAWQKFLIRHLPIRRVSEWAQAPDWCSANHPSIADAPVMFGRYFQVKQEIMADVEALAKQHLVPGRTLGVHYRGTDKWSESTVVSFEESLRFINACLVAHPFIQHLFVATDNAHYCDYLRKNVVGVSMSDHADHLRSSDGEAVHLSAQGAPYSKGYDALVNCLLLSKCDVLLKSLSNLSAWSKVFNPTLPVYLMNKPAGPGIGWLGFPELEMVRRGWFAETLPGIAIATEKHPGLI